VGQTASSAPDGWSGWEMPRYNWCVIKYALFIAALMLVGCGKNIQNQESVRQAILDDIAARQATTGVNMSAMDVNVSSVSFAKEQARATVMFTAKGSPGGGGMSMDYVLAEKSGKWVVTGRQMSVATPHGAGELPAGAAPQLPPGHPTTELPPGHPSTESKQ
jgi:hypothetical protein